MRRTKHQHKCVCCKLPFPKRRLDELGLCAECGSDIRVRVIYMQKTEEALVHVMVCGNCYLGQMVPYAAALWTCAKCEFAQENLLYRPELDPEWIARERYERGLNGEERTIRLSELAKAKGYGDVYVTEEEQHG